MAFKWKEGSVAGMISTLKRTAKNTKPSMGGALYQEGNTEMTEAKKRTPVDTRPNAPHPGQLRASGRVSLPKDKGTNSVQVVLSFGDGPAGEYAIYVHENPDAHHPIGQWKYLESVLMESAPYMAQRVASHIDLRQMTQAS